VEWVDWKKGAMLRAGCRFTEILNFCKLYIPDLPTYLVFYLETTHGSSIDMPTTTTTPTLTHFKSFYIPERLPKLIVYLTIPTHTLCSRSDSCLFVGRSSSLAPHLLQRTEPPR
jgi:hypothetical protein